MVVGSSLVNTEKSRRVHTVLQQGRIHPVFRFATVSPKQCDSNALLNHSICFETLVGQRPGGKIHLSLDTIVVITSVLPSFLKMTAMRQYMAFKEGF